MKKFYKFGISLVLIVSVAFAFSPALAQGPDALPEVIQKAMIAGIMDEFNAYNTYQAIMNQFGQIRPFINIQGAEQNHINAWKVLFDRYGVAVPEVPPVPSISFNSLTEACAAAAAAEGANATLYDQMQSTFQGYPDMLRVVGALRSVSLSKHLPAFLRCAR